MLLVSVPYAMKAADAQTLGGLPVSAFMLAASPAAPSAAGASVAPNSATSASTVAPPPASSTVTTAGGTVDAIPMFSTGTDIESSILSQTGTTGVTVNGSLTLLRPPARRRRLRDSSQAEDFVTSTYNTTSKVAVPQTFQWQAEPVGNNTGSTAGKLNLLFASGTATPAETGLSVSSKGVITFASGQDVSQGHGR